MIRGMSRKVKEQMIEKSWPVVYFLILFLNIVCYEMIQEISDETILAESEKTAEGTGGDTMVDALFSERSTELLY